MRRVIRIYNTGKKENNSNFFYKGAYHQSSNLQAKKKKIQNMSRQFQINIANIIKCLQSQLKTQLALRNFIIKHDVFSLQVKRVATETASALSAALIATLVTVVFFNDIA